MLLRLHERNGVVFHLGTTARAIDERSVTLTDETILPAELVLIAVGVRPRTELAASAQLAIDDGILVDEQLRAAPGIYAVGDAARVVKGTAGGARFEHWVEAERQGQAAARNLRGAATAHRGIPFFWTAHYDVTVSVVGDGRGWDRAVLDGDLEARDARVELWRGDRRAAVVTLGRDRELLEAEARMEEAEARMEAAAGQRG
jgi:3-phenylpropionate/trans-cinnamate dioxygenase ferredoxin reductase subunit